MKKVLIFIVTLYSYNASAQSDSLCFGKAILPDIFQSSYEDFPVYTGDNFDIPFLKALQIIVEPETIKWEEQINENCLSPNPEDCKMMCSIKVPAVIENYIIVLDTSLTQDYKWEKIKIETLLKKGGTEEYIPVICPEKIDPIFVRELTEQLQNRGYYNGRQHNIISTELKDALLVFQKENGLPVGQLDLTTLSQLGFGYTNK